MKNQGSGQYKELAVLNFLLLAQHFSRSGFNYPPPDLLKTDSSSYFLFQTCSFSAILAGVCHRIIMDVSSSSSNSAQSTAKSKKSKKTAQSNPQSKLNMVRKEFANLLTLLMVKVTDGAAASGRWELFGMPT